jgi:formylglycine-generating enzyme required for sulfatase activity
VLHSLTPQQLSLLRNKHHALSVYTLPQSQASCAMLMLCSTDAADFFDGKHFVLRGASSVTNPAVRRDSFRNFYQKQYPHVFAKFRLCYDAAS